MQRNLAEVASGEAGGVRAEIQTSLGFSSSSFSSWGLGVAGD